MAALNRFLRSAAAASHRISPARRSLSDAVVAVSAGRQAYRGGAARRVPADRGIQCLFLGPPGVGKSTYASRVSRLIGVPHIATGDKLHEMQGKLVPDQVIIDLLSKRLRHGEAKGESGFILDGFPLTIRQAEMLEEVIDVDLVVNLKLSEDILVEMCLGRRMCEECLDNFNLASINIKGENGRPSVTMAPLLPLEECRFNLVKRDDDTEEVIKERLRFYNDMSRPVEEFYRSRGKLMEFELPGGIEESWPKLMQALNIEEYEKKQQSALEKSIYSDKTIWTSCNMVC